VKRAELPPRRGGGPDSQVARLCRAGGGLDQGAERSRADGEELWDDEREARDRLLVPMGERSRLRAMLDRRLMQLRPKPMKPEGEEA